MRGWETQRGWRRCSKCQTLWFGRSATPTVCPAGGVHDPARGNYSLISGAVETPAHHLDGWRLCSKCQSLCMQVEGDLPCAAGGPHEFTAPAVYSVAISPPAAGQRGWRLCTRCRGLCFEPDLQTSICPAGGLHEPEPENEFCLPEITNRLRLHTKVLLEPRIPITTMMLNVREAYGTCGIDLEWASHEVLSIEDLEIVEVGDCRAEVTGEIKALFSNRNFVEDNDVVVYFVRSTIGPTNGCARHPEGLPGAVISSRATEWTLAHELGHVLGLKHAPDGAFNRLMFVSTNSLTEPPPDLDGEERARLMESRLAAAVGRSS